MPIVLKRLLHASEAKFLACPDCGAFILLNHVAMTAISSRHTWSSSNLCLTYASSKIPWHKQDAQYSYTWLPCKNTRLLPWKGQHLLPQQDPVFPVPRVMNRELHHWMN